MEIIRKKICLDDFKSHINGALDYCSGSTTGITPTGNNMNFGGFVQDSVNSPLNCGWSGGSLNVSGETIIRATDMMRRYNVLLEILRHSIHLKHSKNLSCKGNAYYNKFYDNFDFPGTTDDFFFNNSVAVLYESAFTYNNNYYIYNGSDEINVDYVILISDEDIPIYEQYFGFDFVKEVHGIAFSGDSRFNQVPYIPINVLLVSNENDLGLMSLYEDNDEEEHYNFPKDYSNENDLDWFEKSGYTVDDKYLFNKYLDSPEPGYKEFLYSVDESGNTEDERPRLESKLTTLREKIYIQDDEGQTLPAIFQEFSNSSDDIKGKFFKAIFYTGASASDGIYETLNGEVIQNTEEVKPFPINSNVYYIIYDGEPTTTIERWIDDQGSHYKRITHCDEYKWWEVIPTEDELTCADDEESLNCKNTTKYRTLTIFETLKYTIIDTPASINDYYYFLVKYDNGNPELGGKSARIPYSAGTVFNKDAYEFEGTITYTGDKIIDINESDNGYIEFTYVIGGIFSDSGYTDYTGGTIYNEKYAYNKGVKGEISIDSFSGVSYWYNSIDFDGAKEQIINKDFNLSRMVNMSYISAMTTGDVWKQDGTVYNSPIIKEDYLMGFSINGITDIDVEINRGNAAAFESHFRLSECNSVDDLETNGNGGFFNIE